VDTSTALTTNRRPSPRYEVDFPAMQSPAGAAVDEERVDIKINIF